MADKGYYVADGKSVTTKRGIVSYDDEHPEITPGCLGADPKSQEDIDAATETLNKLVERGILTYSEGVVMRRAPVREPAAAAEVTAPPVAVPPLVPVPTPPVAAPTPAPAPRPAPAPAPAPAPTPAPPARPPTPSGESEGSDGESTEEG